MVKLDGAGSPRCESKWLRKSWPRIPADVRRQDSEIVGTDKQELPVTGFQLSEGHFVDKATGDGGFSGRRLEVQLERGGEPELAGQARVHLIALAAGVQQEPVRAMPVQEDAVDDRHSCDDLQLNAYVLRLRDGGQGKKTREQKGGQEQRLRSHAPTLRLAGF